MLNLSETPKTDFLKTWLTVKILLNALHSIWMPKMAIFSVNFGISGTSSLSNAHFENVEKYSIFLSSKFLTLLFRHITHTLPYFFFEVRINGNIKFLTAADRGPPKISDPTHECLNVAQQCSLQ